MTTSPTGAGPSELTGGQAISQALRLARRPGLALLGIAGPPGAGKSTVAEAIVDAVIAAGRSAVLVPMDGFHLAQAALEALGLADVKGAPETFDALGFTELLRRVRSGGEQDIWAPRFDRSLEDSIAASIRVPALVDLVVTEGNYLLLTGGGWESVRPQLDACWFVDVDETTRRNRLRARHESYGRTPAEAAARTLGSDEANAVMISGTRGLADAVIRWSSRDH